MRLAIAVSWALAAVSAAHAQSAPATADAAYDARLRASAAAAEQFQGPLDGSWVLEHEGGGALFALQLADKGERLEGAWRDLRRPESGGSGFLDQATRTPAGLSLRFSPPGQAPVDVELAPNLRGRAEQAGRRLAVSLRRPSP